MAEKQIGVVSHWFGKISVAAIALTGRVAVGDRIHVLGHTTDFEQEVASMQVMHQDVSEAGPGDDVAIKLVARSRGGDRVLRVE
jgi:selenocysteine-specific translation elongation factor